MLYYVSAIVRYLSAGMMVINLINVINRKGGADTKVKQAFINGRKLADAFLPARGPWHYRGPDQRNHRYFACDDGR